MSVAASIVVRAMLDEFDVSFVCGTSASSGVRRPPRPRRRLPRRLRRPRPRGLRPPGQRWSRPTPACCSSSAARPRDFDDLPRAVGGLPARGAPLRHHRRPRRATAASPRPAACPSSTSPTRTTSAVSCAGACDERTHETRRTQRPAGARTRVRPHALLPDRHSWVDLGFTLALAAVALTAFGSSFTGSAYLVVGLLGTVIAILVTHLTRAAGWPVISAVVICLVLFFLLGGPLCLRSLGDTYALPGSGTLARVADQALFGWKDLLTTLPPVDGDGPLLVLPWLLGDGRRARRQHAGPPPGPPRVAGRPAARGRDDRWSSPEPSCWGSATPSRWSCRARSSPRSPWPGWRSGPAGRVPPCTAAARRTSAGWAPSSCSASQRSWPIRPAPSSSATTRSARWPATGSSRPSTSAATPRRSPASASTSTSRASRTRPTSTTRRCSTSTGCPPAPGCASPRMDRYDGMVWGATDDALPGPADDSFQRVSSTIDNPVEGNGGRRDRHARRGLERGLAAHRRRPPVHGLPDR